MTIKSQAGKENEGREGPVQSDVKSRSTTRVNRVNKNLESSEIHSLLLIVLPMLVSGLVFFHAYLWLFIILALADLGGTLYGSETSLALDRFAFAVLLLVFSAAKGSVVELILEASALTALLDFSFFLRRIKNPQGGLYSVARFRLVSYLYSLVPATAISTVLVFELSSLYSPRLVNPSLAPFELGVGSIAVLASIVALTRLSVRSKRRK